MPSLLYLILFILIAFGDARRTTYKSKNAASKVWNLAKPIKGKNSDVYRQDPYGNQLNRQSYGSTGKYGWQIDHIIPQNRGGSNDITNLQALSSYINMQKGDSLVKKSRHSSL